MYIYIYIYVYVIYTCIYIHIYNIYIHRRRPLETIMRLVPIISYETTLRIGPSGDGRGGRELVKVNYFVPSRSRAQTRTSFYDLL